MTSIADATGRAVTAIAAHREPPAPAGTSVQVYRPPTLSAVLRCELERALAGPLVLPSGNGDDAAMILHPDLTWQPDAADAADALRAGMSGPASRETVEQWLTTLAMCVANAPTDPAAAEMQFAAFWRMCGQFPAAVWSDESLDAYCDVDKFWPAPAVLRQFLNGRVALIEERIAGFDRIAKAPRERPGPARASTAHLDAILASGSACVPPEKPAHASSPKHETVAELEEIGLKPQRPQRSPDEQRAAYGVTPEAAALALAEIAARRSQPAPVEAIPVAPAPSPDLPVVRLVKALATPRRRAQGGRR